jgi:chromosome segregation ATPase
MRDGTQGDEDYKNDQHLIRARDRALTCLGALAQCCQHLTLRLLPNNSSTDPRERLKQLRTIKIAYERMIPETPDLPSLGSALPTLLATRTIKQSTLSTKQNIESSQSQLESCKRQISHEEAQISDYRTLATSLSARMARLQDDQQQKAGQSSTDKAKDLIRVKNKRKQDFQREINMLQKALDDFIDEHLAAMLAAEELGGPVVGELADVDEDMLTAGFSNQGKPKSSKKEMTAIGEAKRQRRIDEIWGGGDEVQHENEKDAAAEEVRELLVKLLDAKSGYVDLERDTAAARFMVRAKVAQFHPKDAKRLRLIDFARELDV